MTRSLPSDGFWTCAWAASMQGPYPVGNATGQPEMRFVFPNDAEGARDQSFRIIIRPCVWGRAARIRFTNVFGNRSLHIKNSFLGLHMAGGAIVPGTNRPVFFEEASEVVIPPGRSLWSDPVLLEYIEDETDRMLLGRKIALSFHVSGASGPMSWHAKALQTSYISAPSIISCTSVEAETGFPFPTTSWFFIDALDMECRKKTPVIVCLGDSITDGSGSTINGDDRWPDVLCRRLQADGDQRVSVINQGIGANEILQPVNYDPAAPTNGGPSALARLDRDVVSLSGVNTVIWLEGINDLGHGEASVEALIGGTREVIQHLRVNIPGVHLMMGTLTSTVGATIEAHGRPEVDKKRKRFNAYLQSCGLLDGVIDFDKVTRDPISGGLREEMKPGSSIGGSGDGVHPNRIGYQAMAKAIDLSLIRQFLTIP